MARYSVRRRGPSKFAGRKSRYGAMKRASYAKTRKTYGGYRRSAPVTSNYRTGGFDDIEVKFVDYTYDEAIVSTVAGAEADPATPGCISAIQQGDGESQRDGRKATLTSVYINGTVQLDQISDATSITNARTVRLALVLDTQTNSQQENSEDVFTDPGELPFGFRNLAFTRRFKVLWDKTFNLQASAAGGNGTQIDIGGTRRNFSIYKKLRLPVIHTGTTAAVASISDNSLHLVCWSDAAGACTLKYNSRVRFTG